MSAAPESNSFLKYGSSIEGMCASDMPGISSYMYHHVDELLHICLHIYELLYLFVIYTKKMPTYMSFIASIAADCSPPAGEAVAFDVKITMLRSKPSSVQPACWTTRA